MDPDGPAGGCGPEAEDSPCVDGSPALAALWALLGAGLSGCATQSKRPEAPLQFRQWTAPSGSASASSKEKAPAEATGPLAALMARPAASPASAPAASIATAKAPGATAAQANANEIPATAVRPRYKPGSWLFRRLNKPVNGPPAAPPADPSGSLARFFPTLYGQNPADPARLARVGRPQAPGRPAGLTGASVEMTRNTLAPSDDGPPLLADGIAVRANPKAPSLSLPAPEAVARRDEPGEQLTSHEAGVDGPAPSAKPDLIDALAPRLEIQSRARAARPGPDDAPTDPNGRATSATVEVPAPEAPPGAIVASSEPEAKPEPGITPLLHVDLISSLLANPTAFPVSAPAEPPAPPGPKPAEARPVVSAPATRPRTVRAEPIALPEPEFPATYHTESLRQVAREAPSSRSARPIEIEPAPRKPLIPRLSRLLRGHEPDDAK